MSYYAIDRSKDLKHYGVLGMKWGIRRYENEDGTLTPAGRDHYARKAKRDYIKYKGGKKRLKIYLEDLQKSGALRSDVSAKDWTNTIAYDMVDHGYRKSAYDTLKPNDNKKNIYW